jgi:hypothetical protein
MTPEARASLHLKQHELRVAAAAAAAAAASGVEAADATPHEAARAALAHFEALPWCDVYDESDELMRVKFQLVYAVGAPGEAPFLQQRTAVLHALLRALRDDDAARALLADDSVAICEPGPPGAFLAALRLLPGAALDAALPALHAALAAAVLDAPPYELRWLAGFSGAPREALLAYATDVTRAADDIIPPAAFGAEPHRAALLALRGLLAHGVLAHALRQRHRVDYGVAPPGPGRRKRLAVTFRACDVPSERAEFAHPDATLALTTLSYYYTGLSDAEVLQAFRTLLSLGDTEQRVRYAEWHAAAAPGMEAAEAASVDGVRKLDLSNVLQRALLCRVFALCTPLVDFWLRACVLPGETTQYPQRLRATAWHMRGTAADGDVADGAAGTAVGFSGTNDQHRLLPLHVRQAPLPVAELEATNGLMLALLLQQASYEALPQDAAGAPAWQVLLAFAVRRGAVALIDAGALLAGVDLASAAAHVLQLLRDAGSPLQAAVYFDAASGHAGEWVVVDHQGGRWPKKRAPIAERDAFVLYDEARCRGADMRLRRDAVAVLTLGPRMGKDKLMQAAGRMRQLERGQRLLLTAQRDVHDAICAAADGADVSVRAALGWVLGNTVAASRAGLLEWSLNGLHYASTHGAPDAALADEKLSLDAFYAAAAAPQDVGALVAEHAAASSAPAPSLQSYADEVQARASAYGAGALIVASALEEECERELEQEEEQEQEQEVQVARRKPCAEADWDVARVTAAGLQAVQADAAAGASRLADAVERHLRPEQLRAVGWNPAVWLTRNFVATLQPEALSGAADDLSLYQRHVDALLLLHAPNGAPAAVLALSDREAETVLEAHWQRRSGALDPLPLLHHSYARDARDAPLMAPRGAAATLADAQAASLQLLNGETMLGDGARIAAAAAMLAEPAARTAALALPALRGTAHLIARSDLEACCEGLAGGAPTRKRLSGMKPL